MKPVPRIIVHRLDLVVPRPPRPKQWFRLGDFVAFFAKPIARFIDRKFHTHLTTCRPCGQRQTRWNEWSGKVWAKLRQLTRKY